MVAVEFIEVGRAKRSWTEELPNATQDQLAPAARRGGPLMSTDVSVSYNEQNDGGTIHAGMHTVGRFRVVRP